MTLPSSPYETKPHGALSSSSPSAPSISTVPTEGSRRRGGLQVFLDQLDRLLGMAHVRAVAGRLHHAQGAPGELAVQVLADRFGRDHVLGALEDERWHPETREVLAI